MALTLLELVNRAGQGDDGATSRVDVESSWSTRLKPSVATMSDFTVRKAEKKTVRGVVEAEHFEDLIVRKDEGWEVEAPNVDEEEKLLAELKGKSWNAGAYSMADFVSMVRPVLERASGIHGRDEEAENGAVDGEGEEHPLQGGGKKTSLPWLFRNGGPRVGRKLLVALVNCSIELQFWRGLIVLMECGLVSSASHPDLMRKFVEHRQVECIMVCFHNVLDLTPSDILMALKFFFEESNASKNAFEVVRKVWRRLAISAIDYAAERKESHDYERKEWRKREKYIEKEIKVDRLIEKYRPLLEDPLSIVPAEEGDKLGVLLKERERRLLDELGFRNSVAITFAVAMALAVDGFEGWETCVHALVASGQDEAVLAAIIRELETSEAVRLLRYLRKWLDRYSNQLSRVPSPHAPHQSNKAKRPTYNVPTSQQVIQWVSMVLDGQYTKCVLSSEFLPELRAIQKSVDSVLAIGRKLVPLVGMVEHFAEAHPLPARQPDSTANSDYTIEYLDIS